MKVTEEMINTFRDLNPAARNIQAGLEAVLKDVPDVVPFADPAAAGRLTYIHPSCWTVIDADPAMKGIKGSVWTDIEAGDCDCENTSPWQRIYVEREAK